MDKKPIIEIFWMIIGVIVGILYLGGTGVIALGKQTITYLNSGNWYPNSGIQVLLSGKFPRKLQAWAAEPDQLYGVHEILENLNGGGLFIFAGVLFCVLCSQPMVEWDKKNKKRK